jgi:hypothetical protein
LSDPLDVDENGWARGAVVPLPVGEAWTLLSPEPSARVDAARWAYQAERFFGRARVTVVQDKRYPAGTVPLADRVEVDVGTGSEGERVRVLVVTVPADRAPEALSAGAAGARAIGGAGFDALVPRTRRVWQVCERPAGPGDPRAPLVVAAVLASLFLAPIVPPGGGAIFGVKGARERLASLGLRT